VAGHWGSLIVPTVTRTANSIKSPKNNHNTADFGVKIRQKKDFEMRDLLQTIYICFLRMMGLYALFLVGWFFASLPWIIPQAHSLSVVLSLVVFAIVAAILGAILLLPRWTPKFLAQPNQVWHLFPVLIAHGILPLVYIGLSIMISFGQDVNSDAGKTMALMIAITPVVSFGLMWWMGLFLCVLPGGGSYTPPKRKMPKPMTPLDPPKENAPVDARSLRKSRMS
jgi:hypothetical protein